MVAEESAAAARLMGFRVGRGRFAVPLARVAGVLEPAPVAGGKVVFRGREVPVVDARSLGWAGAEPGGERGVPAAVVVECGAAGERALLVDRVEGIVETQREQPLPGLVAAFVRRVFSGVAPDAAGGRLVVETFALVAGAGETAAGEGAGEA